MKTSKPDEQVIAREDSGQWKTGQSGNPKGRTPGFSITAAVRRELENIEPKTQKKWGELVIRRIMLKATNEGDTQMLKAIWAYIDGMPKQSIDVDGTMEHTYVVGLPEEDDLETTSRTTDSSTKKETV